MCNALHISLHIKGAAATLLLGDSPVTARSDEVKQFRPLTRLRQADRKFGEFAEPAVDLDRLAVLLHDDLIGDRQAEPGAFAGAASTGQD